MGIAMPSLSRYPLLVSLGNLLPNSILHHSGKVNVNLHETFLEDATLACWAGWIFVSKVSPVHLRNAGHILREGHRIPFPPQPAAGGPATPAPSPNQTNL